MAESSLTSVLHHLRCLAETGDDRRQSDRQLLERFAQQHDESAFAVLMRRHGRLVLSAIHRVLHEEADVEDAFQATFLVLLRKASSVRWQASLGSWLFGVAHRIALKARANALRRQRREAEASRERPPEAEASADISWREALGLLHEELDRLPDKYRLPLLLCYLDGKTREEAAAALACTGNAIKWQLERGRELLRSRLVRRGVTLSGTLLAALVDAPAARSVAPALIQTTLKAARTGINPSSVAALMKTAVPTVWMGKTRLTLGVLLTVSLLGVGGGSALVPPNATPQPPAVPPQAKEKSSVILRGRVFDPDGKPVRGARLYSPHAGKDGLTVVQRGVTDVEGRFRFELPRADARPAPDRALIAAADGYGVQWIDLPGEKSSIELKLRLVKDQAIQGRILSTEGKPVASVRVQVVSLKTKADDRLDDFFTAWQRSRGNVFAHAPKHLDGPLAIVLPSVSTDKEGRFRLAGIGAERIAVLKLEGAGIARASLYVVSRPNFDPAPVNKTALDHAQVEIGNRRPPLLYGPTFDYVAESGRVIEGTIRAVDSGDPLPGFTVSYGIDMHNNSIRSISDKHGRFRLEGVPKRGQALPRGQHWLEVEPPANSSWLRMSFTIDPNGVLQPLKAYIRARRGVLVVGRVIDRTTGQGVMCDVQFVPLPGNKFFGKPGAHSLWLTAATDAEGRFRMPILPGSGVLMAAARATEKTKSKRKVMPYKQADFDAADRQRVPSRDYSDGTRFFTTADNTVRFLNEQNAVKYLDLAPDAAATTCDLFVDRGKTMTIPLQDEEGKPLTGAVAAGVTDAWLIRDSVFTLADTESFCTVYALDPRRPRRLIFHHPKRHLAATLIVRGDEKEPPVVRLAQTGTVIGRVLDQEGRPIAGAGITLSGGDLAVRKFFDKLESLLPPIHTGADGRFRIEGLVPDLQFALMFRRSGTFPRVPRAIWMSLKPGETRDVGDLHVKPAR